MKGRKTRSAIATCPGGRPGYPRKSATASIRSGSETAIPRSTVSDATPSGVAFRCEKSIASCIFCLSFPPICTTAIFSENSRRADGWKGQAEDAGCNRLLAPEGNAGRRGVADGASWNCSLASTSDAGCCGFPWISRPASGAGCNGASGFPAFHSLSLQLPVPSQEDVRDRNRLGDSEHDTVHGNLHEEQPEPRRRHGVLGREPVRQACV